MVASISVILNLEVKDFFAKQKPPIAILLRTQFIATLFTLNLVPYLEQLWTVMLLSIRQYHL